MSQLPTALMMKAGAPAQGIVPQTFDECFRMAKLLSMTTMVPDTFRGKENECCVAIMQGLEVGLSPMAALQSIAVINGRPSIWGDGALAIVRASGLVEDFQETDDGTTATCAIKRRGDKTPIVRKFSTDDAKKANLATKKGPWQEYPARMRQMRARSWALRDGFADVLKGLHIAEETRDFSRTIDAEPTLELPPPTADLPDIPDETAPVTQEVPEEGLADPEGYLAKLEEQMGYCQKESDAQEIREANLDLIARLSPEHKARAEKILAAE